MAGRLSRGLPRPEPPQSSPDDGQRLSLRPGGERAFGASWPATDRVGNQLSFASEFAELGERVAAVAGAAVTAIQAVCVPADDFTDPAVTTLSSHMDSSIVLSHSFAAEGLYPAVNRPPPPRFCSTRRLWARSVPRWRTRRAPFSPGSATYGTSRPTRRRGVEHRRPPHLPPRPPAPAAPTRPFAVTEGFTGTSGRSDVRGDMLKGLRAMLDGEADDWAESPLYVVSDIDKAREKEAPAGMDATRGSPSSHPSPSPSRGLAPSRPRTQAVVSGFYPANPTS